MQNMYLSQQPASMRYLFIWLIGLLPGLALAQSLSIGRSTLTLPDPLRWQVHDLPDINLGYTGDKTGSFIMEAKRLVFRSSTFSSKAVAMLGVTKGGVGDIQMSWTNTCAKVQVSQYLYMRDVSNGSQVDCLLVVAVGNTSAFLGRMPAFKNAIADHMPVGVPTFYIEFQKSLGAGGYAFSQLLLAQDFKGTDGGTVSNATVIPTPVLAWAEEFAKSSRRSIGSLGGSWTMPPVAFERD